MQTSAAILKRIQPLLPVDGYRDAEALLRHPQTRLSGIGSGGRVTRRQMYRVWGNRLAVAKRKGIQPVSGLPHLVDALERIPDQAIITRVAFENDEAAGIFWFIELTSEPLGFVVVKRSAGVEVDHADAA